MNSTAFALDGAAGIAPKRRPRLPFSRRTALAVGAAVAVALGGAAFIAAPKASESTDAAYVQADTSVVAPRVRGLVAEVMVRHNQKVHRGDPLVRIDPEEFDARVATAAADLMTAEAGVQSARAALASLGPEQKLAEANVRAAAAVISAADAQRERADADRARYEQLVHEGAVAKRDADAYRAVAAGADSDVIKTRAQLDVSRNQAEVVAAKRATLEATLAQAEAGVARARAALDLARQDQAHTVVRSPIDGVVGDRQAEPGDYVQPGTRLMIVAPLQAPYVVANFKETQVARMRPGQPATVKVDALPGVALKGEVESFAPGSGSTFSLLPFEPGTGNFTKIVQRVPVRIRLDAGQKGLEALRPGLSTTVKVGLKG
ncbi:MAG: HlyD family secretion protein [Proteobacteria bacterium]|nr:HlyD family secretion protein [Pseudomonadota bacterium]